ncbi:hypothetical protein WDZ92_40460 [Nostoc sp. NIES-2111]
MIVRPINIPDARYEVIADKGGDVETTRAQIDRYTAGECMVLAMRVFEITGWSIVAIRDGEGLAVHYLNRRPDGTYIDAHGQFPEVIKSLITRRHEVAAPIWKTVHYNALLPMNDDTRREVDAFLDGAWMRAVIPMHERRARPLRWDDEDNEYEE